MLTHGSAGRDKTVQALKGELANVADESERVTVEEIVARSLGQWRNQAIRAVKAKDNAGAYENVSKLIASLPFMASEGAGRKRIMPDKATLDALAGLDV